MEKIKDILESQQKSLMTNEKDSRISPMPKPVNGELNEEEEFNAEVRKFILRQIGLKYLKDFREEEIRNKDILDEKIRTLCVEGTGIILSGNVGVGKTMDMVYIFKQILKNEKAGHSVLFHETNFIERTVKYYFMPDLFQKLHFAEPITLAKYVLIDDWGREYAEPFALSQFEILMEKMYQKEIRLIITTNLPIEEFLNRQDWDRIIDRVREMCGVLKIQGNSRRHK